jgi:hypothetical protein
MGMPFPSMDIEDILWLHKFESTPKQTSIFDDPPAKTERQLAQEILSGLVAKYPGRTERFARLARYLCHRNIGIREYLIPNTVSSDDLWDFGGIAPDVRNPDDYGNKGGTGNNFLGAVFGAKIDGKKFVFVTTKRSRIKGHHSRRISLWTIPEYESVVASYKRKNPELF